jgi:hypothetical protein
MKALVIAKLYTLYEDKLLCWCAHSSTVLYEYTFKFSHLMKGDVGMPSFTSQLSTEGVHLPSAHSHWGRADTRDCCLLLLEAALVNCSSKRRVGCRGLMRPGVAEAGNPPTKLAGSVLAEAVHMYSHVWWSER